MLKDLTAENSKIGVIVTGASSGIGAEIAREFSRHGFFVLLLGRSEVKLKAVQTSCPGPTAILAFDLKDIEMYTNKLSEIINSIPRIEVLINNAGIYHQQSFLETTDEMWHDQFVVNVLGPVRLTRFLWPYFLKNKKGSILNISSTLGLKPVPSTSAYSATKAALNNFTQALAQEGASHNIRVNAICPGIVDTPIHSFHAMSAAEKEKFTNGLVNIQLLSKLGQPADIAKAAYFLASDQSAWTTGAILSVDGGINLK